MPEQVIDEPEALDMILGHLLGNKGKWIDSMQVHQSIFSDIDISIFDHLINRIITSKDSIIEYRVSEGYEHREFTYTLKATGVIEHFLNTGGYTKTYADAKKAQSADTKQKELAREVLSLQIKVNKRTDLWAAINSIIALVSLIVAIIALWRSSHP